MTRWTAVFAALLFSSAAAFAAPPTATDPDDLDRLVAERSLFNQTIGQIEQVGQTVRDKTSDLVGNAMGFLGVPYRRGGSSAETGFDCSGFVRATYAKTIGLMLPRRADEQAAATDKIDKSELKPGDLVFFNTMRRAFSHVGIYLGDGKFIHSPRTGAQVRVEDMGTSYWARRFEGARRVDGGPAALAAGSAGLGVRSDGPN
jgi:cell wall-associated NlpC family hydrolase